MKRFLLIVFALLAVLIVCVDNANAQFRRGNNFRGDGFGRSFGGNFSRVGGFNRGRGIGGLVGNIVNNAIGRGNGRFFDPRFGGGFNRGFGFNGGFNRGFIPPHHHHFTPGAIFPPPAYFPSVVAAPFAYDPCAAGGIQTFAPVYGGGDFHILRSRSLLGSGFGLRGFGY